MESGKRIKISSGKKVVGLDVPAGRYVIRNEGKGYSSFIMIDIINENGDEVNHIFSGDETIETVFEDGCRIRFHGTYFLEKV